MKRDLILQILQEEMSPLTAEQIYSKVCNIATMNLSTVYRNLNTLVEKGILLKEIRQDKIAYFEISSNHNHAHYLICDSCKKAIPTDFCKIEKIAKEIKKETGFNITSHTLELHGICKECKNQ